jgi:hypothetical protein
MSRFAPPPQQKKAPPPAVTEPPPPPPPPVPQEEVHWNTALEALIRKKAEKCQALYVVHNQAGLWCHWWDTRLQIIAIIFSTFSGAGAVGSQNLLPFSGATTFVGVVSLLVGMLQTVINRLAFATRAESHRIASLAYQKLYNYLDLQLSMPRKERHKAQDVIEMMKSETDRLAEIEMAIPERIKSDFHSRFGKIEDYSLPTILNGLDKVVIYREPKREPPSKEQPPTNVAVRINP